LWDGNCCENSDDRHYDQQLDKRKTFFILHVATAFILLHRFKNSAISKAVSEPLEAVFTYWGINCPALGHPDESDEPKNGSCGSHSGADD
jgi:hypothetical protein